MDATEIADFLDSQQTGVLALASEGDAYAVPVSYAYDIDEQAVYFRLGFAPGSQKQRFIDTTEHVSFVVYGEADGRWNSVLVSGRLEPMAETNLDSTILEAVKRLDIPYFKVFDRPAEEVDFTIVRLNVDGLNGIVEGR
jgi:nitroimidazol reductase NimA-like FMN-containing flavoprotein (pyridoxamine 5'-phosphate oxidase superfamily)